MEGRRFFEKKVGIILIIEILFAILLLNLVVFIENRSNITETNKLFDKQLLIVKNIVETNSQELEDARESYNQLIGSKTLMLSYALSKNDFNYSKELLEKYTDELGFSEVYIYNKKGHKVVSTNDSEIDFSIAKNEIINEINENTQNPEDMTVARSNSTDDGGTELINGVMLGDGNILIT